MCGGILVGLTSFGATGCDVTMPQAYTRVKKYVVDLMYFDYNCCLYCPYWCVRARLQSRSFVCVCVCVCVCVYVC